MVGQFSYERKPLEGRADPRRMSSESTGLVFGKSVRRPCDYLPMGRFHFLTGCQCVFFEKWTQSFLVEKRVNPLCCGREKMKPVYVVPVVTCLFVVVKKENPLRHVHQSVDYGCECIM